MIPQGAHIITRYGGLAVIGDFQEKQHNLLLIFQHHSMLKLLCTGTTCINTTKYFIPLYNDSI